MSDLTKIFNVNLTKRKNNVSYTKQKMSVKQKNMKNFFSVE